MNSFGKSFSWSMLINCRFVSLSVSSFSAAGDSVSTCKASNARLMLGSAYHAGKPSSMTSVFTLTGVRANMGSYWSKSLVLNVTVS